ncbi:MAG: recombinase family protein [Xanthobacteraceae bacterium]
MPEKASRRDLKTRPQLAKAIDFLSKGDVLLLAEWDRATRSMLDGIRIIERVGGGHRRARAQPPPKCELPACRL